MLKGAMMQGGNQHVALAFHRVHPTQVHYTLVHPTLIHPTLIHPTLHHSTLKAKRRPFGRR
jgi:hypothetical protein